MNKKKQEHLIHHQVVNLEINGVDKDSEVKNIQESIAYFFKSRLGEELDKRLSNLVPPDVYITLDKLEINLDEISFKNLRELENKLYDQMKRKVGEAIKKELAIIKKSNKSQTKGAKKASKANIFEHFMRYGNYPAWGGVGNGTIQDIFKELLDEKSDVVLRILMKLRSSATMKERLYQQFKKEDLTTLAEKIYGSGTRLSNQIKLLKKRLGGKADKLVLSAAINFALGQTSLSNISNTKVRSFSRVIIEDIQKRKITTSTASKVRAGYTEDYSDIEILQYFLEYGGLPDWADVDNKKSFKELFTNLMETKLASVQRMVERNAKSTSFIRRLVFQFQTEDILKLLEPTSGENIFFIKNSLLDFEFLTDSRKNIKKTVSKQKIREVVLVASLDYFFTQGKNRFIKQTFLQNVLVELADLSGTDYELLVKESYKSVRRKKKNTIIQATLENIDGNIRKKLNKEKEELRSTQKQVREIKRDLARISDKLTSTTLSEGEIKKIKKDQSQLLKQLEKSDRKVEELADEDMPLDIELVMQQRLLLQNKIQTANTEIERKKVEDRLGKSDKEFQKLQTSLKKELAKIIKERKKYKETTGAIGVKKLKRVENRLKKYERAVVNILDQLLKDEKGLLLFLGDIRVAMRTAKTTEERRKLRQERDKLQKQLISLQTYIAELKEQSEVLAEQFETKKIVEAVETDISIPTETSKLDFLIFFLKYGSTPWWAESFATQSIEEIFLEFVRNNPAQLTKAFNAIGQYPIVWERMINQLSETAITELISKIYGNDAKVIFAQAEILFKIHYSQAEPKLKKVAYKTFKWQVIVEYLMTTRQGFNEQKFAKEIVIQTAKNYRISSSQLLKYTYNIAQNGKGTDLEIFAPMAKKWLKDKDIIQIDRELIAQARQEKSRKEGVFLTDSQQMALLIDFLQKGSVSAVAKDYKYNTAQDFENLLYEQIQKNKNGVKEAVFELLKLSNTRNLIIHQFTEDTFWEICQLIQPKVVLVMKRYFADLKQLLGDSNLHLEKEVLLNLLFQSAAKFEPIDFVNALIATIKHISGRTPIAIVEGWKRKTELIKKTNSSLLLSILAVEVNLIKEKQKKVEDIEIHKTLQKQLLSLSNVYNISAQKIMRILTEEMIEGEGITEKKYKLSEINSLIAKLKEEKEEVLEKIETTDAFNVITLKRELIRLDVEMKLLALQKPPTLRLLNKKIEKEQEAFKRIAEELKIESAKNKGIEELEDELIAVLSLVEQQITILELISKEAPTAINKLEKLLIDIADDDQTHYWFVKEVEQLTKKLKKEDYATQILLLIGEKVKEIPLLKIIEEQSEEELRKEEGVEEKTEEELRKEEGVEEKTEVSYFEIIAETELGKQEKHLIEKIETASPFELWKDWDNLKVFYGENKKLQTKKEDKVLVEIYRQIKRKHQQNLMRYAQNMQKSRAYLYTLVQNATTLEQLMAVQIEIEKTEKKQTSEVVQLLEAAREKSIKEDFEKMKISWEQIFIKLKNERIAKSNRLVKGATEGLEQQKSNQALAVEELIQQKNFLLDVIQKEEEPNKTQRVIPKKKNKKKKAPPPLPAIDEVLQVNNAGLVLIYPYVSRLFKMFKLVEGKEFVSEEAQFKGIHLLQYLATGRTEAPENELVLNKIFCGVPLTTPVPLSMEFTEQELKITEGLLLGAAKNWPRMKTMSPNAFRGTFLMREATIKEADDRWKLVVRKTPVDILLKTIPWGFTFVKFPWLTKFIAVEWPLM